MRESFLFSKVLQEMPVLPSEGAGAGVHYRCWCVAYAATSPWSRGSRPRRLESLSVQLSSDREPHAPNRRPDRHRDKRRRRRALAHRQSVNRPRGDRASSRKLQEPTFVEGEPRTYAAAPRQDLGVHRPFVRGPLATGSEIARQDPAYPVPDAQRPDESLFADWRKRLVRNLSRRSDGRWDPLTYIHARRDSDDDS